MDELVSKGVAFTLMDLKRIYCSIKSAGANNMTIVREKLAFLRESRIIVMLLIFLQITGLLWVNFANANIAYARVIRNHLEKTYGERFYVQRWANGEGPYVGPMFFTFGFPVSSYFYAHPRSDPTYVFRVHVTRAYHAPIFRYRITELQDRYYWRFLRVQLEEYVKDYFQDLFGEDIKVDMDMYNMDEGFSSGLNQNSTLEDFFASKEHITVAARVFVPNYDESTESLVREAAQELLLKWYNTGSFSRLSGIYIDYVHNREAYDLIDTSIEDSIRYDYSLIWGGPSYIPTFWGRSIHSTMHVISGEAIDFREVSERIFGVSIIRIES